MSPPTLSRPKTLSKPPSLSRNNRAPGPSSCLRPFALAKLYQSAARLVEAHAVLAPALEGFSPTPEMPVIAKAQTLLAALAETEEVKAAEAADSSGCISKRPTGSDDVGQGVRRAEETRAASGARRSLRPRATTLRSASRPRTFNGPWRSREANLRCVRAARVRAPRPLPR